MDRLRSSSKKNDKNGGGDKGAAAERRRRALRAAQQQAAAALALSGSAARVAALRLLPYGAQIAASSAAFSLGLTAAQVRMNRGGGRKGSAAQALVARVDCRHRAHTALSFRLCLRRA